MTPTMLAKPVSYQRLVLVQRPAQHMQESDFRLETCEFSHCLPQHVLLKNHYLSIDPYMRGRMNAAKSYAAPQELGQTMLGATVGQIIESADPAWPVGTWVAGMGGWSEYSYLTSAGLRRIDPELLPLSAYLGVVGMPGMTAWYGVHQILQAQAGQTLLVSASAGAVGSVVGQLAKHLGCRVIGIAGGTEKCQYLQEQLGFDLALDYKAANFRASLDAALAPGVDLIFENVGGEVFDLSLRHLNPYARIALCGLISAYDGQTYAMQNLAAILSMRARLQGFIITEHLEYWPQGLAELAQLVTSGRLKYKETVSQGLASAPAALAGLLSGKNFGKQLVQL